MEPVNTRPKLFCFVLMPFDKSYNDVYQLGIKEACNNAGAYCERLDEQIFEESMLERVYNQIAKADIIIADLSERNPNVFYEIGYAHALGKRAILLTRESKDIPFDLQHHYHIIYEEGLLKLKQELTNRITWYVHHPPENDHKTKAQNMRFYINEAPLLPNASIQVAKWIDRNEYYESSFDLVGHYLKDSTSELTILDISIKYPKRLGSLHAFEGSTLSKTISIPGEQFIYNCDPGMGLFPGKWDKIGFRFKGIPSSIVDGPHELTFIINGLEGGPIDIPFMLTFKEVHENPA